MRARVVIPFCFIISVIIAVLQQAFPKVSFILSNRSITNFSYKPNVINLYEAINENISCVKTKFLLNVVRTTICIHSTNELISRSIAQNKIWEEDELSRLFRVLIRDPGLSFIDVGANLGVYALFAATLNRFVIAIECFKPNVLRIAKAAQLEKIQHKLLLIENAIFSESGKYVQLESLPDNIGGQALIGNSSLDLPLNNTFTVKTIRFDDILPFLKMNDVQRAIIKIDIEGSEHFLCNTGHRIFQYLQIPVVLMEWQNIRKYKNRGNTVLRFFMDHGYIPTQNMNQKLVWTEAYKSWPWNVYWMNFNSSTMR